MSDEEKKLSESLMQLAFLQAMAQALEQLHAQNPHRPELVFSISQEEMEVAELERMFRL